MFFELTQLSGLYFIYPRGYRLFDVDDLILNTLGGLFGYFLSRLVTHFIPQMDKINEKARERGKIVSGFRRSVAFLVDFFIVMFIDLLVIVYWKDNIYLTMTLAIFYYIIVPLVLKGSTLAQKFLNIVVIDDENKNNLSKLLLRKFLAIAIYIIIPFSLCYINLNIKKELIRELLGIVIIGIIFIFYLLSTIKYLFTKKEMLYEKISKTKLKSTIE